MKDLVKKMRAGKNFMGEDLYPYRKQWEDGLKELVRGQEEEPLQRSGAKKRKRVNAVPDSPVRFEMDDLCDEAVAHIV